MVEEYRMNIDSDQMLDHDCLHFQIQRLQSVEIKIYWNVFFFLFCVFKFTKFGEPVPTHVRPKV